LDSELLASLFFSSGLLSNNILIAGVCVSLYCPPLTAIRKATKKPTATSRLTLIKITITEMAVPSCRGHFVS
jgi:hypothetical protein